MNLEYKEVNREIGIKRGRKINIRREKFFLKIKFLFIIINCLNLYFLFFKREGVIRFIMIRFD